MEYTMTLADYDRVTAWLDEHADDPNVREIICLGGLIADGFERMGLQPYATGPTPMAVWNVGTSPTISSSIVRSPRMLAALKRWFPAWIVSR
jgi:hypothetical protein